MWPFSSKSKKIEPKGRFQLSVLFKAYPALDHRTISDTLRKLEPGQSRCTVEKMGETRRPDGRKLCSTVVNIGSILVAVLVHDWPYPESEKVKLTNGANIPDHEAYALISVHGEEKPIEKWIAAYKVALALSKEKGAGMVNEQTGTCVPKQVFHLLNENPPWNSLRKEAIPTELLFGFKKFNNGSEKWLVSQGGVCFGFPELAFCLATEEEKNVTDVLKDVFCYLYERGPVIKPGDTMELGTLQLKFSTAPKEVAEAVRNEKLLEVQLNNELRF